MGNKETTLKEIFEDIDTSKVELVRANNAKIMLIVWPKKTQMLQNLSAKTQKFWVSMKKRLHWASVVRGESLLYISFTKLKTFHLNLLFFPHLRLCIFDHGN